MSTAHFNNIAHYLRAELIQAKHSIKLAMAWLTEASLLAELKAAAGRGVKVEAIVSRNEGNQWQRLARLAAANVEVLVTGPSETGQLGFLHHKFCIIDYSTVITGSYNWSKNAARNTENIIITHADQTLAVKYLTEFQHRLAESIPLLAELATDSIRPEFLPGIFGWRRNRDFSSLNAKSVAATPQAQAAQVRLWAVQVLGTPGDETTLHWQAPPGLTLILDGLSNADYTTDGPQEEQPELINLPLKGSQTVVFSEYPNIITLIATTADGMELVRRTVRLIPAWLPVIELLELDRPTIVGRVMPAKISWRVNHAETVRLEPGPAHNLPIEGELMVSPGASATYTLIAQGLGGEQRRSVSLGVFPVPVLSRLEVPILTGLRTEVHLYSSRSELRKSWVKSTKLVA